MASGFALLLVLLYLSSVEPYGAQQVFSIICDFESQDCQGESLETIALKVEEQSDVVIDIKIPQLNLNGNISFKNLPSLTINGKLGLTTITCKDDGEANASIVFSNITDKITLNNLNLTFCGSRNNGIGKDKTYSSALTIVDCRNVELNGLVITRSRGLGLAILNHQEGRVNIRSTIFEHNKLPLEYNTEEMLGGGGVYINLDHCPPVQGSNLTFQFDNCVFENNTAHTKYHNYLHTNALGVVYEGDGFGGGVSLLLKSDFKNVNVHFFGCKFFANQAFHGGGLAVKIFGETNGKTESIRVKIIDSIFEKNGGNTVGFGGGAYLTFHTNSDEYIEADNHYIMKNVSFVENSAEQGGGVYLVTSRQTFQNSNSTFFNNCTFQRNTAYVGSAIAIFPNNVMSFRLSSSQSIVPIFLDCQFLENKVSNSKFHKIQRTHGIGTICASVHEICFMGYNHFENNFGSGIYIVDGIVNFQNSSVSFINNTALQGGAVALTGSSTMVVGPNNYEFVNNSATYRGGAIYVLLTDKTDFMTMTRGCFIQYTDDNNNILLTEWDSIITFTGNKAKDGTAGHAIFATSFYPCLIARQSMHTIADTSKVFTGRGEHITFDSNEALQPQIATDGALLTRTQSTPLMIIPGKKYHHSVTISDDLNHPVDASFRVAIEQETGDIELDSALSTFVGSKILLRGKPGESATLVLQTVSPRESYIRLEVMLTECPPGYMLNTDLECVCNVDAYIGLFRCYDYQSYLLPGYWAGLIDTPNGSILVASASPFYTDYYSNESNASEFEVILPQSRSKSELNKVVCGETRTGIGCGKCQDNYTVYFHSLDFACKITESSDCKLGWLFYILSELVPVTMIFITVLILNISFTSGNVNGFVLFSQLLLSLDIDASGIIVFPDYGKLVIKRATQVYQVIYGFLNLDIFSSFSFCLWKGATALDMIAFKYVTIIYTLLLIAVVIFIMNRCGGRCLGNYCRITSVKISVIHGISTFLVICYSRCIQISLSLLLPLYIQAPVEDNSNIRYPRRVWFNGEWVYFHKEHLPYALPALFCLLTVGLLPPALLLTYPLFNKVLAVLGLENQKVINIISQKLPNNSLKPLLDSFQGCFKDNLRFFAGLYFLYRWTTLLVYFTKDYSNYYTTVGSILLFILTIHTICQPYIKRVHNIIDALLFADLVLINSLSYFNFNKIRSLKVQDGATISPAIVQLLLVYLPLVVVAMYILTIFCKCIIKLGYKSLNTIIPERAYSLRELVQSISSQGDNSDSNEELIHDRLIVGYCKFDEDRMMNIL